MRSDHVGQQFTPSLATEVYHPLAKKDREVLAEMRKRLALHSTRPFPIIAKLL
jgi:hypothetical protein